MGPGGEPIRFVDVLTMAAAVASYLGAGEVTPEHLVDALAILEGAKTLAEMGRPVSPLVPRARGGAMVEEAVRTMVQDWITRPGNDPTCALGPERLELLREELLRLAGEASV